MHGEFLTAMLLVAGCAAGDTDTAPTHRSRRDAAPAERDAGTATGDAGRDAGSSPLDAGTTPPRDAGPDGDDGGGPCAVPECSPGATDTETESCGECGEGTRSRSRTCDGNCRWGAWGSWGSCATSAQCSPGETQSDSRSCGACGSGTETRTRSCDPTTCRWGSWGAYGACAGASGCVPGSTRACANGDSCGHEVCRSDCTWGACEPIHECLRIRPGTSGPEGNNYRCCGTGRWQFCLPSCDWSTDCAACSGCGC